MSRFYRITLLLLAVSCLHCAARTNITSTPSGANILVNGHHRGVTPQTVTIPDNLGFGSTYRIRVEKSGYRAQQREFTEGFLEDAGGAVPSQIHFDLEPEGGAVVQQQQQQQQTVIVGNTNQPQTGSINIISVPDGANVRMGGALVGSTPCTLNLPAGIHIVEVSLPGYQNTQETINVLPGGSQSIRISLIGQ